MTNVMAGSALLVFAMLIASSEACAQTPSAPKPAADAATKPKSASSDPPAAHTNPVTPAIVPAKPPVDASVAVSATTTKSTPAKAPKSTKAKSTTATKAQAAAKPKQPAPPVPPPPAAEVKPVAVAEPPPPTAAVTKTRVEVPSTQHVRFEVPAGLQAWLDADDRMRPWLGKAVAAADGCYTELRQRAPQAAGTIEVSVTMHKDARPSAAPGALPSELSGLVPCVTTRMWSVKMPLFTGTEGDRYTLRVRFEP